MTATEIQDRTIAQTRWAVDSSETSVEFAVKTFWAWPAFAVTSTASTAGTRSGRTGRPSS